MTKKIDDKWAARPPVVREPKLNKETVLSAQKSAVAYEGVVTSISNFAGSGVDVIVMARDASELKRAFRAVEPAATFDPNKVYGVVIMSKYDVKLDDEL